MTSFACYLCTRAGRPSGERWNRGSLICTSCGEWLRATGRRWCNAGRHVVAGDAPRCRDCERVRLRRLKGYPTPSADYVSLETLATQLRTARTTVAGWLKRGWPVDVVRVGRHWYVRTCAEYPPIPDRRKPSRVRRDR